VTFSDRLAFGDPLSGSYGGTATDGPRIYFTEIEDGRTVLTEILIADGETNTLPLPQELATPSVEDIAPDGSRLLLSNRRGTEPEQPLWIASTSGGAAHRIPGILAHAATWAADGQGIIYANGRDLYSSREDGTEQRKLISLEGRAFWLRWSPDRSKLRLTLMNDESHTSHLWEISTSAGTAHDLSSELRTRGQACCGSWTANGKYYVFQSAERGESNIWAVPEHSGLFGSPGDPVPITNGPLSFQAPITASVGQEIFFIGQKTSSELFQFEGKSRGFVSYSVGLRNASRVEFSRDGKWIAWIQDDESLWLSHSDGSARVQLVTQPMQISTMRWSPDGRQLVITGHQPGKSQQLYIVNAEDGHLEIVSTGEGAEADADWSPDGKTLAFGQFRSPTSDPQISAQIQLEDLSTRRIIKVKGSEGLSHPRWSADGKYLAALSVDHSRLMLCDVATGAWRKLAEQNINDPVWSQDDSSLFFHDLAQAGQHIYKVSTSTGKIEQVADVSDLRSAGVANYRFLGLAPGDIPLISAKASAANLYSADLPD
jgi:Tol biopolymer transport system component